MSHYMLERQGMVRRTTVVGLIVVQLRTSCVIGCLRRRMRWSLATIIQEFESYADPEGSMHDILFIENFETNAPN